MTAGRSAAAPSPLRPAVACLAAIGIAVFAVVVDLHHDEVQAPALVLVVGGFLVGAFEPRHAWRWALILGCSIVVGEQIGLWLGVSPPWPERGANFGALVALIPALIGTYVGVGVRRMAAGSNASP